MSLRSVISISLQLFLFPWGFWDDFSPPPWKQSCLVLPHYFDFLQVIHLRCLSSVTQDWGGGGAGNKTPSVQCWMRSWWPRGGGGPKRHTEAQFALRSKGSSVIRPETFQPFFLPVERSHTYRAANHQRSVMEDKEREQKRSQENHYSVHQHPLCKKSGKKKVWALLLTAPQQGYERRSSWAHVICRRPASVKEGHGYEGGGNSSAQTVMQQEAAYLISNYAAQT